MNKIYTDINAATGGKYKNLRFPAVEFDARSATVTVLCKQADRAFVAVNMTELTTLIREICGFHTPVEIVVDDKIPTAASMRAAVVKFTEKFTYISSALHTITAEIEPAPSVGIKMHDTMLELAQNDYLPRLREFLSNNFVDEVDLKIHTVELTRGGIYASELKNEYTLTDVKPLVGDFMPEKAAAVHTITDNGYNVAICGVLAMPTAFMSKGGRRYEKFVLYDGETSVQCRWSVFGFSVIEANLVGKTVCVLGNVEYERDRDEANVSVRAISLCNAEGLGALAQRRAPAKYERVEPEDYYEYVQSSMFDRAAALPDALKGEFVVFDFETTGLSILRDKPTELGAVKIVNGEITQKFSTLIDPRREIPPDVVEKTGITNEMVKGQPLFEDVIPDFYKFSYGCGLIGHNISFDFPFLIKGGNGCGWCFGDRATYDTMGIAPLAIPGIQKLSLASVLEGLGLENASAHRAWADAAATAKAFIAMQRIIADKNK